LGEGMIGWTALHREPVRIDDVARDGRAIAIRGTPLGAKSAIVIPLLVEDRLVGVARAVKMGVHSYTDDHFRFAQTLALQAALAIAAAEAHEEIRRLSITDELTGAFNTRYAMQRMREELEFAKRHDDRTSWGEPLRMTFSVGVATSSPTSMTADDLFRSADRALYLSKQNGRNRATQAI